MGCLRYCAAASGSVSEFRHTVTRKKSPTWTKKGGDGASVFFIIVAPRGTGVQRKGAWDVLVCFCRFCEAWPSSSHLFEQLTGHAAAVVRGGRRVEDCRGASPKRGYWFRFLIFQRNHEGWDSQLRRFTKVRSSDLTSPPAAAAASFLSHHFMCSLMC